MTLRKQGFILVSVAAVLLLMCAVAWEVPHIFYKVSLSQAHAVCSSPIGALGTLVNTVVQSACGQVGVLTVVVAACAAVAIGVGGVGFWLAARPMRPSYRVPQFGSPRLLPGPPVTPRPRPQEPGAPQR